MAKHAVFSPILQNNFKTTRSIFAPLDETHNCLGNFEKFLKIFDENSMEKLNFFSIFWDNSLLKIETSEITSFFYNIFSGSGGFKPTLTPPCVRHCLKRNY